MHRIVIPLYDHATPAEVADLMGELAALGLAIEPVYETKIGSSWGEPVHEPIASRRADLGEAGSIDRSAVESEGL
jgi:hypothetical protein